MSEQEALRNELANLLPLGFTERDPYRDVFEAADALLASDVIRQIRAAAWDEGFDAGERDVVEHSTFDEPCIANPYGKVTA